MKSDPSFSFIETARALAPAIEDAADEIERSRQLPLPLVLRLSEAGFFRLWIPRALGGAEVDPLMSARVVEEIARVDGSTGWCVALGSQYGVFAGYLPLESAREIYGSDKNVITGGAFRALGKAFAVDGGYRVTGRWSLASGCQHCTWMVGGCRIFDGDQPRLGANGSPITRLMFFPTAQCKIIDTWHSIGLRGTGSHDYVVANAFVPSFRSLSFKEPPTAEGPLYAFPTIGLFASVLAAVPLGIARHAVEILTGLAGSKISSRSRKSLDNDSTVQASLGRAEALLRSARAFLHGVLDETWHVVAAGQTLTLEQRTMLWLTSTHAAQSAKEAAELVFSAGGSASNYAGCGLERCLRDVHAACQHIALATANYAMAGQALLGADMSATPLLALDDRQDHRD
jgi:indole-3-acetate monooxygenase